MYGALRRALPAAACQRGWRALERPARRPSTWREPCWVSVAQRRATLQQRPCAVPAVRPRPASDRPPQDWQDAVPAVAPARARSRAKAAPQRDGLDGTCSPPTHRPPHRARDPRIGQPFAPARSWFVLRIFFGVLPNARTPRTSLLLAGA